MEEILASIRRIIADDQVVVSHRPPVPPARPAQPPEAAPFDANGGDSPSLRLRETIAPAPVSFEPEKGNEPFPAAAFTASDPKPLPRPPRPQLRESDGPRIGQIPPAAPEIASHMAESGRERQFPNSQPVPALPFGEDASGRPLISPATDAAVSAAFNALGASRFLQSNELLSEMVRDMIRPLLKTWLDDNLPILVERLVRAEIERVARGGR